MSIQPEDLEDQTGLERKYEEQLRKKNLNKMENEEDFSDMVAEHAARQSVRNWGNFTILIFHFQRKRKAQEQKQQKSSGSSSSSGKKYKDFKF